MARAARNTEKSVESLKHREARRKHIPTTELESLVSECLTRNEARYLNRLSSPPRKRGSRACPWREQGATVRTLRPLGSRFRGNDG
jgi:hypothetical protein